MAANGFNILDKSMVEVSDIMKPYIIEYFANCKLLDSDYGIFQETYHLGYDEVKHLIPVKYQGQFCNEDNFWGTSGYIQFEHKADSYKRKEYVAMLLTTEDQAHVLFLYLQVQDSTINTSQDVLLMDFLK